MRQASSLVQIARARDAARQPAAALDNFQRAYELSADPLLLLEIARLEREVGNAARATFAFEQFLEHGSERVTERRRRFAERQLKVVAASTARLILQTNVQDASIELEAQRGAAIGSGFTARVLLDAGQRKLSLSKPGYETRVLLLELEPGETRALRVDLDKAAGRSEASPSKPRFALREAAPELKSRRGLVQDQRAAL